MPTTFTWVEPRFVPWWNFPYLAPPFLEPPFLGFFMAPIYLLVLLIVSSVIAADTFAGERERKSLESLLYLPATDADLLVFKLVGAWIPAVSVGGIGFLLYGATVNVTGWPVMQRFFFPRLPGLSSVSG